MDQSQLPPELRELESRLANRPRSELEADFRERVFSAMHSAQDMRQGTIIVRWSWRAASVAAVVLFGVNFWLGLENEQSSQWPNGTNTSLKAATAAVRKGEPDLPEADARQQAMFLLARARIMPQPDPAKLSKPLLFEKVVEPWDIP
jgi:hypothetical protein